MSYTIASDIELTCWDKDRPVKMFKVRNYKHAANYCARRVRTWPVTVYSSGYISWKDLILYVDSGVITFNAWDGNVQVLYIGGGIQSELNYIATAMRNAVTETRERLKPIVDSIEWSTDPHERMKGKIIDVRQLER